jgi:TRAP-type mannitol/chloroaromatic compound transport system substrate-binding protein
MRRRDVLAGAGMAAAAALSLPAPAIAQDRRQLTMVTDYPDGPGMLPSARRLAGTIHDASDGRIAIEVSPAGAVVRPLETFDAVEAGVADMFHSHIGYFDRKSPAYHFFSGVPFGFTADELFAWVRFGGGQALWDELSADFNVKPLLACSTGSQLGGWFVGEIGSVEAFKGLRYRMAGPGAEVYRRLGAVVVMVPGAEIVQALRSGAIDACEWVGPWLDTAMGLHEAASYYYYPGWHEPGTALALGINRGVWESFAEADRRLIEAAAAGEYAVSLAEFNTNNALALARLKADGAVQIRRFEDAILKRLAAISREVLEEAVAGDSMAAKVYRSHLDFRDAIRPWSDIAEGAYLGIRGAG